MRDIIDTFDGIAYGPCISGFGQFRIETSIEQPMVELKEPEDKSNVTSNTPKLTWDIQYSNPSKVIYDIYFKQSTAPIKTFTTNDLYKKDYKLTTFVFNNPLTPGETYYWTVIPHVDLPEGKLTGICNSGIWSFQVKLPPKNIYALDLNFEAQQLSISQGNFSFMNISITNLGNMVDTIFVYVDRGKMDANVVLERANTPIKLNQSEVIKLKLEILVSKDAKPQNYTISITAMSNGAALERQDVTVTKSLRVQVIEKKMIPIEDEDKKDEEKTKEIDYLIWSILIILIILFVSLFLYVYRSRRIPYVKSELLSEPPAHLRLSGISGKPRSELELPASVDEDGVISLEGATIPSAYLLPKALLSREQKLELLKERFILGEVSEETYKELKAELESSENKDITKLDELEPGDEVPEDEEAPALDEPVVDEEMPMEKEPLDDVKDIERLESEELEGIENAEIPEVESKPVVGLKKEIKKQKMKKIAISNKKKPKNARYKKHAIKVMMEEPVTEDELQDLPEKVFPFPDDGLCITCGQSLDPNMAYCGICGTKYEKKDVVK